MNSTLRQIAIILTVMTLLATNIEASNSRPPRNNDISNMADALKYLQDLDVYYGDRARVRFGKRVPLMQMLKNQLANEGDMNHPSQMSNPEEPY